MKLFIVTNKWSDLRFAVAGEKLCNAAALVYTFLLREAKSYREEVGEDEFKPEDTLFHEYSKAKIGAVPEGFAFTEYREDEVIEL